MLGGAFSSLLWHQTAIGRASKSCEARFYGENAALRTSRIRNIRFQPAVFRGNERISVETVMKDLVKQVKGMGRAPFWSD